MLTQSPLATLSPTLARHPRGRTGVVGLHHVALVVRDLERTTDFYGRLVGLRDLGPGTAPAGAPDRPGAIREAQVRWLGDATGRAGSLVALHERPGADRGRPGLGGTHHFALAVRDREALLMWKRRFLDEGYAVNGILDRHYFESIYVQDPDGTIVEFATLGPGWTRDEDAGRIGGEHRFPPAAMVNTNRDRARIAAENWPEAVRDITPAMTVQGMHHVTAIGASIERLHDFVHGALGMRLVKRTNNFDDVASYHWYWGIGAGHPGTLVTYFERDPAREPRVQHGAGQVAHYAVGVDTTRFDEARAALRDAGSPVSDTIEFGAAFGSAESVATVDPDGQPVVLASVNGATSYDAHVSEDAA